MTAPRLIPEATSKILPDHLPHLIAALYTHLVMAYNTGGVEAVSLLGETLQKAGNQEIFPLFYRTRIIGERDIAPLGDKDQDAELRMTISRVMAQHITRRRDEIASEMQKAEAVLDRYRVAELTREFHELL